MNPSQHSEKQLDIQELETAINTLDRYNEKQHNFFCITSDHKGKRFRHSINHIVSYVRQHLKEIVFSKKEYQQLAHAIETIQNYYPLIKNFQVGTDQERTFAQCALESIKKFNHLLGQKKHSSFLSKLFFNFHLHPSLNQINFPFYANLEINSNLLSSTSPSSEKPTAQEIDLFTMKAITLLRKHHIPFTIETLKKTPIFVKQDSNNPKQVNLSQCIEPFPGEKITFEGGFLRNNSHQSVPIKDSFNLACKAIQSGFPHPLLHHGFAFSSELIPSPRIPSKITRFKTLLQQLRETALQLLPQEGMNMKAKKILNLKRTIFNSNKEHFINLHRQLAKAIIHTPSCDFQIDQFYSLVETKEDPYSYLAGVHHKINTTFIQGLHKALHDLRIKQLNSKLDLQQIEQTLKDQLHTILESIKTPESNPIESRYISLLGNVIAEGIIPLFLQEASEVFAFSPPLLNQFSRKIQTSLYHQFLSFHEELHDSLSEHTVYQKLQQALETDLMIFRGTIETEMEIDIQTFLNELESYYYERYRTLSKRTETLFLKNSGRLTSIKHSSRTSRITQ